MLVKVPTSNPSTDTVVAPLSMSMKSSMIVPTRGERSALEISPAVQEVDAVRSRELLDVGDDRPSSKKMFWVGNCPEHRLVVRRIESRGEIAALPAGPM